MSLTIEQITECFANAVGDDGLDTHEPRMIRIPAAMYDAWELALRAALKSRFPNDDRSIPVSHGPLLDMGKENFMFSGYIFVRVGE